MNKQFRGPHPTDRSAKRIVRRARLAALDGNLQAACDALSRLIDRALRYHEKAAMAAADEALRRWEDTKNLRAVYADTFLMGREASQRGREFRNLVDAR